MGTGAEYAGRGRVQGTGRVGVQVEVGIGARVGVYSGACLAVKQVEGHGGAPV